MATSSQGGKQTNGVISIMAPATAGNPPKASVNKPATPKLKVIVRRLAPGLKEEEFKTCIGDEWKVGNGKVDWFDYEPGKDSKNPSKPSRPSRAYLNLTSEAHVSSFLEVVRQSIFEDARNTFSDPALVGPPSVEFAPYNRIPGGRRRTDARAGTIDQDPEFMSFLEGLANPSISKEEIGDATADGTLGKLEKVTMTPLVQYLKDKKASKNKDVAAKAAKKQEAQSAKGKLAKEQSNSSEDAKKKANDSREGKFVEKAAKEAVKILNREAARAASGKATATATAKSGGSSSGPPKLDVSKIPGRQRNAVVAAHIRMLQRDLGLSPAQAHRQVRRDTADAQKAEKAAAAAATAAEKATSEPTAASSSQTMTSSATPTAPTAPKALPATNNRRSRTKGESEASKASKVISTTASPVPAAPVVLLKKPEAASGPSSAAALPAQPAPAANTRKPPPATVPTEGATHAFVKHANPSQGVTESLLKEAMEKFGAVSMVEIDKRKGFAYVDFVGTEGLKKAMAANPIPVAQGTVQVMQRKGIATAVEKKPPNPAAHVPARGGRGGRGTVGRRGGRGGGGRGGSAGAGAGSAGAGASTAAAPPPPATPTGLTVS